MKHDETSLVTLVDVELDEVRFWLLTLSAMILLPEKIIFRPSAPVRNDAGNFILLGRVEIQG